MTPKQAYRPKPLAERDPAAIRRGKLGARKRWGEPRILRRDQFPEHVWKELLRLAGRLP